MSGMYRMGVWLAFRFTSTLIWQLSVGTAVACRPQRHHVVRTYFLNYVTPQKHPFILFWTQWLQPHSHSLYGAVAPIFGLPCAQGFQRRQSRFSRRYGDDGKISLRGPGLHRPQSFHGPGRNLPGVRSQNGGADEVSSGWGRT